MKTLYTILFFLDTMVLMGLSFLFLKMMDNGGQLWVLIMTLSGIIVSIVLLIFFFKHYIKYPYGDKHKRASDNP